ncbi:uncharacterized protein RAG0_15219 [Rhynchosporium agropyri]|uniref:2EXR domain-containing protein n=1 Tax=Rhynchosporium agropyri TaxID=914238 RepID=A0A1E1LKA8_9HELO|nr:uncharacterized protein RAG0_15219 [Rhynchosporium agropyri]
MAHASFVFFPKLPYELQLYVWEMIDILGTVIRIGLPQEARSESFDYETQQFFSIKRKLPAIFHACHSSRKVALRSHPLRFGNGWPFGAQEAFPYNAKKDLLLFNSMNSICKFALSWMVDFQYVQQLAFEPGSDDDYNTILKTLISTFGLGDQLRKIQILPSDDITTFLAALAEKDGSVDFQRIDLTLQHLYILRIVILRLKGKISEERECELLRRDFCVMSPAEFAAQLDCEGALKAEHDFQYGCRNLCRES